jgi:CO/xanthine dehydrogenase Mo-binding subunit
VQARGSNVGTFEPMSIAQIAAKTTPTHGAIAGHSEMNVTGAGPGFGLHIVDVEVDKETGRVDIKRYTVVEDAGKAIHPLQVEGQYQGGAVQGIGWALNEKYYYGEDGRMQNASFLDYRMPVASDVPMIETEIVEVPNPRHPYGLRGVGEVPVVPTMAAIANAIGAAIGIRPQSLPMSPPKLLKLMDEARGEEVTGTFRAAPAATNAAGSGAASPSRISTKPRPNRSSVERPSVASQTWGARWPGRAVGT